MSDSETGADRAEATQPISVTVQAPGGITKETLDELDFVDQDPPDYDPIRIGMATNDLDLDEVNDNLCDFGEDNLSLEVNFGDGSSCRASDVSSLSFQNIVLDDMTESDNVEIHFRRDSLSDSSDSPLNEYSGQEACQAFSGRFQDELKRREEGTEGDEVRFDEDDDSYCTSTMKRRSKMSLASSESDQTNTACSDNKHCDGGGCTARFSTNNPSSVPPNANPSHHALQEKSSQSNDTNAAGNENEAAASGSEAGSVHGSASSHQGAEQTPGDQSCSCADSEASSHSADAHVSKRNSLEVRNNIPDVTEIRSYSDDSDDVGRYQGQGAIPKMKKKSPGLARRLVDATVPDDRDTSSSERELENQAPLDNTVISAQKDYESSLGNGTYSPHKPQPDRRDVDDSKNRIHNQNLEVEKYDNVAPPSIEQKESEQENGLDPGAEVNLDPSAEVNLDPADVINEYDYVKYARIQKGDSYVGMRLAYSTSNDSLVFRDRPAGWNRLRSSDDERWSSREGSPEKIIQHPRTSLPEHMSNVNEETLTEIPLNGNEAPPGDDHRNFSLSPEATDCDSAEVESVLSEEGKSSASGMPMVEDGLSSSQGSDTEDTSMPDMQRPAEILKRRYKAGIEQELQQEVEHQQEKMEDGCMSSVTDNSSELSTPSHDNGTHRIQREALDLAIKDIQSAIERSKSMTLKSPSSEGVNGQRDEPVWIMRDSYVRKLQRQDDIRKIHSEIDKQKDEELLTKEQEQVYQVEDEDEGLMKYQFSRNDGKAYQPTRGFDSDDEYEGGNQPRSASTRHVKGKKYASLPADDPVDAAYFRVRNVYYPPNYSRFASRSDRGDDGGGVNHCNSSHADDSSQRPPYAHDFSCTQSHYRTEPHNSANNYSNRSAYEQESSSSASEHYSNMSRSSGETLSSPLSGANHSNTGSYYSPPSDSYGSRESYRDTRRIPEESEEEEEYVEEVFHRPSAYIRPREAGDFDTDEETDELLDKQYVGPEQVDIPELSRPPINRSAQAEKRRSRAREVTLRDPDNETVLIEGVLFRARYLGSTQLISEGQPSKAMRMMQAQEAVGRIKAPEGESQPSTEVDLFISTEKLMVLNTDLQEIMMDHSLRTISYIADIGDILVLMARRGPVTSPGADGHLVHKRQSKICCHVFDTEEAQLIAQSIGQAFQVAYMEFLKANGIEDPGLMKEMDYQEVLNQQEIFGEELHLFSNKEMQKEVIVPKLKGELLGIVIVESGWGSMVPTVVLANMSPAGAAARCGQLNIGDQIMSINGVSLVGLPLSSCQTYIKAAKNQTVVKLTVVSCPPVVEVCIKRPDVKYQLGFSVQNGVICSLLRGGIAERGGVRVGHRIIEINSQSVVAVAHDKIVNMLATSVGEIHMKTMPTSIYRLLTGQDTPHYL